MGISKIIAYILGIIATLPLVWVFISYLEVLAHQTTGEAYAVWNFFIVMFG